MRLGTDFGDIFSCIDEKYDYWRGLFESVVHKYAPVKRKRVREQNIPYITRVWKNALRIKRKYTGKLTKDRTEENLELKRKYQNIVTHINTKYWVKNTKTDQVSPKTLSNVLLATKARDLQQLNLKTKENIVEKD